MSQGFGALGDILLRDGTYLNVAADFSVSGWASQGGSTPAGGAFRPYYTYGDRTGANPYIFLGSAAGGNTIVLAVYNGTTRIETSAYTPITGDYFYWTIRYTASTHALDFIVDAFSDNTLPIIVASLTVDLSAITFSVKEEAIGGSWPDFKFSYYAVYQSALSLIVIRVNRTLSDFNSGLISSRRSFTRLLSDQSLDDTTGAGRGWTLTGTLPYPVPVGSIIYRNDFDGGDKDMWANWRTQNGPAPLIVGGCTPDGFVFACNNEYILQEIAPSLNTLSIRVEMAALVGSAIAHSTSWELATYWAPAGLGLFLFLNGDGSFDLRTNNVESAVTSPVNLFPNDGSVFALQWRLSVQTNHSVLVNIDINNTTVWTVLYDWAFADPTTTTGVFNRVQFSPQQVTNPDPTHATQLFFDQIEVSNTATKVSWLPCGITVYPPCWVPPPPAFIDIACETVVASLGSGCPPDGSGLTLADAIDELAARLDDPTFVHWTEAELALYLREALRTYSAYTQRYRDRATFGSQPMSPFYDLPTVMPTLRGYHVTVNQLIADIEYALMEPPTTTVWTGTEMFTLALVLECIQSRLNQFHQETGGTLARKIFPGAPDSSGRVGIPTDVITINRAAWVIPGGRVVPLKLEDEWAMTHYTPTWPQNPSIPSETWPVGYSIAVVPPSTIQLAPVPTGGGSLDLLVVATGPALDPDDATLLGVPDDWSWVIKWGALSELLSRDGLAFDPQRSAYCEARYQLGVKMAKQASVVLNGMINNRTTLIKSVVETDEYRRNWQGTPGVPTSILTTGWNVVGLNPPPPGTPDVYSITLDVVANVFVPTGLLDCLPIDAFQRDCLMDYAEHLAKFKEGPGQLQTTMQLYENFARCCGITVKLDVLDVPDRPAIFDQQQQDDRARSRDITEGET